VNQRLLPNQILSDAIRIYLNSLDDAHLETKRSNKTKPEPGRRLRLTLYRVKREGSIERRFTIRSVNAGIYEMALAVPSMRSHCQQFKCESQPGTALPFRRVSHFSDPRADGIRIHAEEL
jgi:hypothetical protein